MAVHWCTVRRVEEELPTGASAASERLNVDYGKLDDFPLPGRRQRKSVFGIASLLKTKQHVRGAVVNFTAKADTQWINRCM